MSTSDCETASGLQIKEWHPCMVSKDAPTSAATSRNSKWFQIPRSWPNLHQCFWTQSLQPHSGSSSLQAAPADLRIWRAQGCPSTFEEFYDSMSKSISQLTGGRHRKAKKRPCHHDQRNMYPSRSFAAETPKRPYATCDSYSKSSHCTLPALCHMPKLHPLPAAHCDLLRPCPRCEPNGPPRFAAMDGSVRKAGCTTPA